VQEAGLTANTEWRTAEGSPVDVLAQQARYADLTILSQGDPELASAMEIDFPGDLAIASGRPVLVIPHAGTSSSIGRRPLIAWNGSREAARAVGDAMSLLQDAEEVCVLTVAESTFRETAGTDLARFLGRHGIATNVQTIGGGELDAADAILTTVMEQGCDLVVMGSYGHSRWRQAILGGATRSLLRQMSVPVLMSH
jgi:nucleotide-binding universal stress UspA family protein